MFLVSSGSCLCPIHWGPVWNREWRCSRSRTNRQCSNYILSDQQLYCLLWWSLYWRFDSDGLTHWGRVTHICVGNLTIIGSDNGLSPSRRQAIFWTNAGILLIGPLGTNFSETLAEIITFSFKKMYSKVSFAKWRPFCLGLNVLTQGLLGDMAVIFKFVTLQHVLMIDILSIISENALKWIPQDFTDGMSTLVQVMAWCPYLSHVEPNLCWHMASLGHNELM